MALWDPGSTQCPLCNRPVADKTDFIAFTYVELARKFQMLNDAVAHRSCLGRWDQRDAFLKCWNMACPPGSRLRVDSNGAVKYASE